MWTKNGKSSIDKAGTTVIAKSCDLQTNIDMVYDYDLHVSTY